MVFQPYFKKRKSEKSKWYAPQIFLVPIFDFFICMKINLSKILFLVFTGLFNLETTGKKLKVLFIGNSYIYTNNLPDMIAKVAISQGDTMIWDGNLIGGFTLANHFTNAITRQKIGLGNWDFVIIQAQSQEPAFPDWQVNQNTIPFARKLDSLVNVANSCTETQFFMTWGRKNGDSSNCPGYPPICTFTGMQNLLRDRYLKMSEVSNGSVSPVGEAWRNSIFQKPFLELFSSDQSHPSVTGTFLSSVVFYQSIFRKTIQSPIYKPAGIQDSIANFFTTLSNKIILDSASKWFNKGNLAKADFSFTTQQNSVQFVNKSLAATQFTWDFGNGIETAVSNPLHVYSAPGNYLVKLVAKNICRKDSFSTSITILPFTYNLELQQNQNHLFPNPCADRLNFKIQNDIKDIEVLDLTGKRLKNLEWDQTGLKTERMPPGSYIIVIYPRNREKIKSRFIKF